MNIPFSLFEAKVREVYPDVRQQMIPTAANVHIYDRRWLQEKFTPAFDAIRREINDKIQGRPLENNPTIGICDEITARYKAELILATRQAYPKTDMGSGFREASIMLPAGCTLNMVPGPGAHRNLIIGVTDDQQTFEIVFSEPQLIYANYEITSLKDAAGRGVDLVEHWL